MDERASRVNDVVPETETTELPQTNKLGSLKNTFGKALTAALVVAGLTAVEKTAAADDTALMGDAVCARPTVVRVSREGNRNLVPRATTDNYHVQEGGEIRFVFHRPIGKAEGITFVGNKALPVGPVEKEVVSVDDPNHPGHQLDVIQDVREFAATSTAKANSVDPKDAFISNEPGCKDNVMSVRIIERNAHMGDLRPIQNTQVIHGEKLKGLEKDSADHAANISTLQSMHGRLNASFTTGLLVRPNYSPAPIFGGYFGVALADPKEIHGELGLAADVSVGARAPVENLPGYYTNGTAYQTIFNGGLRLSAVIPAGDHVSFLGGAEVSGQGLFVTNHDIGNSLTQRNPTISQTDGTVVPGLYGGMRLNLGERSPFATVELGASVGIQAKDVREQVGGDDSQRANAAQAPNMMNGVQYRPAIKAGATW